MRSEAVISRGSLIAEAAAVLRAAGLATARREALRVWAELSGSRSPRLSSASGPAVAPDCAAAYVGAIRRRAAGEPLAHVTGWAGLPASRRSAPIGAR